jgi:serine/threonine protein kinase
MARTRSELAVRGPGLLEPGALVDEFRVERVLSVGAGDCTLCQVAAPNGQTLALKLLGDSASQPEAKQRCISMTRARASTRHPNLVPLVKAGEHQGRLYIVSALPGARTLADRLDDGPLDAEDALRVAAGVAGGLEAAAAQGLVHAELTPQSVLLGNEKPMEAFLTDFGIGRTRPRPQKLRVDVEGLDYRSPEEIKGAPPKPESNAYSLACVLFECLTGTPPYPYERPLLTLHAQLVEPPPRPSSLRDDLPAGLDDVFDRAMAKEPDRRLSSTAIVREAAEVLGVTVEIPLVAAPPTEKRRSLLPKRMVPAPPRKRSRGKQRTAPPLRRGRPEPAGPGKPPGAAEPDRAAKPVRPAKQSRSGKPQHAAQPEHKAKPEHAAKPERAAKPEHTAKPERAAKPEHTAKPGRVEKPARPAKPRAAKPARPARRQSDRHPSHGASQRRPRRGQRSLPAVALVVVAVLVSAVSGFSLGSPDPAADPPRATPAGPPPGTAAKLARAEYVRSVSPVIDRLSAQRAAARRRLRRAKLPASQADAARSLVKAYAKARRALSAQPPASLGGADLRQTLRGAERAYRRLAHAARSENRRAWRSASRAAVEQERRFERSLRSLTAA